jgi:hypothetical protein
MLTNLAACSILPCSSTGCFAPYKVHHLPWSDSWCLHSNAQCHLWLAHTSQVSQTQGHNAAASPYRYPVYRTVWNTRQWFISNLSFNILPAIMIFYTFYQKPPHTKADIIFRCIHKTVKSKLLDSSCLSICPSIHPSTWNNTAPTGWIFINFHICWFFLNLSKKFKFHYSLTRITGNLLEDLCKFMIISPKLFLEREMLQARVVDKIKTHILCSIIFS